ncbi:hypothetical protein FYJ24_05785 [Actinomycetaceae bacterium WB03_NA08]|uniref:Uncharacterized protein n=1 Tax=Scrofimicrobium canadense TaxID=2652290 RepID=A0A6N7VRA8_9ACTO|nr:hypothetical protein [Scrofimicrobium canadense]MSS84284.1 hypothetical protein [Scrofimicrobium canadense]
MTIRGFWARRREGLSLSALLDEKWINPESIFCSLAMKPGKYVAVGFLATPWNFTSEQPLRQPTTLEELKMADAEGGIEDRHGLHIYVNSYRLPHHNSDLVRGEHRLGSQEV